LATAVANETRLHFARGLDPIWASPCAGRPSPHERAFAMAVSSMRDCAFGPWDQETQQRQVVTVGDPVAGSLTEIAGEDIYVSRLGRAISACGAAASQNSCVQDSARELLLVLLDAQRRGLLSREFG